MGLKEQFECGEGLLWNVSFAIGILAMGAIVLFVGFMVWIGAIHWIAEADEWLEGFLKWIFGD